MNEVNRNVERDGETTKFSKKNKYQTSETLKKIEKEIKYPIK